MRKFAPFLIVLTLAAATAAHGAIPPDAEARRVPSRYDAGTLPVFEIDPAALAPAAARERLAKALGLLGGGKELSGEELGRLGAQTRDDEPLWRGELPGRSGVEYSIDRRSGRLEVHDRALDGRRAADAPAAAVSRERAIGVARDVVAALGRLKALDPAEYDLQDLQVAEQRSGFGEQERAATPAREWVESFHVTAKRQLGGVPVLGSAVRVVVDAGGGVAGIEMGARPLRGAAAGERRLQEKPVPIDRTAEQAFRALEEGLKTPAGTRLHVERWGLVYLETGAPEQRYYQPVYAFAVVPLTDTKEGTIAARKLVRVVPASSQLLEPIAFDPAPPERADASPGDDRPKQ